MLALFVNISSAGAQEQVSTRPNDPASDREIVVIGQRSGEVFSEIRPIDEIDENEIGAFASGSISELLGSLSPQTRGSSGTAPVIFVNGKRIGSSIEVGNLPPEALVKLQIFPEQLAQSLGVSANQRVVNLVLKKDFRAITSQAETKFPTEGAGNEYQGRIDLARIEDSRRWNISAQYTRREAISENDRAVIGGRGDNQTLVPKSDRIAFTGAWTDYVFDDIQFDLGASINAGQRVGRIANRSGNGPSDPPFFLTERKTRAASLTVTGNGGLGDWSWFASGSVDYSYFNNEIDYQNSVPPRKVNRTEARTTNLRGSLLFNGSLVSVPAGDVSASVETNIFREINRSDSELGGSVSRLRTARTSGAVKATLAVPLTSSSFLGSIGRLTANFEGGVETVSNLSSLTEYGYGLRWAPHPSIQWSAFWSSDENAPGINDLSDPLTLTPDVAVYDFVRGESAVVTLLDGGNPALNPETSKSFRMSLSIRPEKWPEFSFNASYSRRRLEDAISSIPAISPELADAFPDRFVRGQDGRLQRFDVRPVNLGRSRRESANWTLTWSKQLSDRRRQAEGASGDDSGRASRLSNGVILFSIDHQILLRDQRELLPGGPSVNFLNGSAGGSSKHKLEFSARALYRGIGMNLNANWASGYRERAGAQDLKYRASSRFDVKLFANLDQLFGKKDQAHWSNGLRATLSVENLFNSRRRVIDQNDNTPLALQPRYLDPLGRTIQFSLRKVF